MAVIKELSALEILDSRGNPTVEVKVTLESGACGVAGVPSGASTGTREAIELRDQDPRRYLGKGVVQAVSHVNQVISEAVVAKPFADCAELDKVLLELDGTESKSKLGANALLGVSLAVSKAMAAEAGQPLYRYLHKTGDWLLPVPMMNIINGGAHADNNVDIQEFMILPLNFTSFSEALRAGVEVFHALKTELKSRGLNTAVGDEGGFAPDLASNAEALAVIMQAIEKAGYKPGSDIALGLDIASSEFYNEGVYHLSAEGKVLDSEDFVAYQRQLVEDYPIITIEDGMAEDDWQGWSKLTAALGAKIQLVGDDLFVTNTKILKRGIDEKIANSILIKPNQIGTLSETLAAITMAQKANYGTVMSHRSGETEDTTIADLVVATSAGQIKTGSLCRSDRVAKYNRLLRIESELANDARYLGAKTFTQG